MSIHHAAQAAITAAKQYNAWGRFAAIRYAEKRGANLRLVTLARTLEAASKAGE